MIINSIFFSVFLMVVYPELMIFSYRYLSTINDYEVFTSHPTSLYFENGLWISISVLFLYFSIRINFGKIVTGLLVFIINLIIISILSLIYLICLGFYLKGISVDTPLEFNIIKFHYVIFLALVPLIILNYKVSKWKPFSSRYL
ncbi:hypothetical protein HNQ88_000867 [Aureibacter tunicatorum]|uniref:Uncharacterized protein n=1 Tax=Aureibacter tunicatorum TaxID=866807 RepID=A0AAE3XHN9_9BACT|nr:hypothetical protein [Aureibacter tunicatorum]BDD02925.1 hypothetical protein AUTU_04080 [Aureibacter tunicatorum]